MGRFFRTAAIPSEKITVFSAVSLTLLLVRLPFPLVNADAAAAILEGKTCERANVGFLAYTLLLSALLLRDPAEIPVLIKHGTF